MSREHRATTHLELCCHTGLCPVPQPQNTPWTVTIREELQKKVQPNPVSEQDR